ncbi:MAG: baseplate J/gp47 family protein [Firmicutes bacterium]|nr:baseplate J/gp47 family protein [Bacillota bacterium]
MAELPPYLEDQTYEAILQRMLNALPPDISKAEGDFIWDSLSPTAIELALAALWAQEVLRRGFASTTFDQYLDMRCGEHGVIRRPAVKATGKVKFTGTAGAVVPSGIRVATPADPTTGAQSVEFITTESVTLDANGEGFAAIEAVEAGSGGNVVAGAISVLVAPVTGVNAVTNPEPTTGGIDTESDESLLNRYYLKVRTPATSGNKAHYMNWALEVPGVGDAKVIPLWNGPGTVKVLVVDSEKQPASPELVAAVAEHIEEERPIGAAVTVVAATGVTVSVTATVTLDTGYILNDIQTEFVKRLRDYFASIAFRQTYVSYAQIGSILLGIPGVMDYSSLQVNGGTANVTLGDEGVPVLGTVTLSV